MNVEAGHFACIFRYLPRTAQDIHFRPATSALTTQAPAGVGFSPGLVADLATNTGTETDGGKTWKFTIVDDAKWQDGRSVTCEDVRYGISRNFARDRVAGGSPWPAALLDVPLVTDAAGLDASAYAGPYRRTGQALFYDPRRDIERYGLTDSVRLLGARSDDEGEQGFRGFHGFGGRVHRRAAESAEG